jgi:thiol-disulfide isomerase/thioredoxin
MRKLLASVALAVAFSASGLLADEPVDVAAGLKKIAAEQMQKYREASGSQAKMREAFAARNKALQALVKQAEDGDPAKLSAEQQAALASTCMQLSRIPDAVKYAEMAIKTNPDQKDAYVTLISAQARQGNVDAAEASLAEMTKRFADAPELSSMHDILYFATSRNPKTLLKAADHAAVALDLQTKKLGTLSEAQATFAMRRMANDVEKMVRAYGAAEKQDAAMPHVDACMTAVAALMKDKPSPAIARLASDLVASKAKLLASMGKKDEAQAMVREELERAQKDLAAKADDTDNTLRVAAMLGAKVELSPSGADQDKAGQEHLAFLGEQVKKHVENRDILMAFVNANAAAANALQQNKHVADAVALLKSGQDMLGGLESPDENVKKSLQAAKLQLQSAARRFESDLMREKLIGQPAIPVETSDWVNGSPVVPADTKGKVVLLDFWAVWCGPCVSTFPHLREWHEKYSDKGLVIIGATQFYGYGWNAEGKHIEKIEALSHADELAAMAQFAKHHELHHALAVMPDRSLSQKYGVTGIPQAVVIDRAGKVRMIRVGSGPANAKDLQEMIEKCLAESPEAAAAAAAAAAGGSGAR